MKDKIGSKRRRYNRIRYSLFLKNIFHIIAMYFPNDRVRLRFYRLRGTKIGKNVGIGQGAFLEEARPDLITIEDNVNIGPKAIIVTHDSSDRCVNPGGQVRRAAVRICKNSFIGAGSIILPGVTVGERSIVAAGSVVTKDVPPKTVVGGVPARALGSSG